MRGLAMDLASGPKTATASIEPLGCNLAWRTARPTSTMKRLATRGGTATAAATATAGSSTASRRATRHAPKQPDWGSPAPAVSPAQLAEELSRYAAACAAAGISSSSSASRGSSSSSSIMDSDSFVAACLEGLAAPHRLSRLRPSQLAAVLQALAALGAASGGLEEFLADVDAACYCHPGPFSPASVTSVMQSLARLHGAGGAPVPAVATADASSSTNAAGGSSSRVSSTQSRAPSYYSHRQAPRRAARPAARASPSSRSRSPSPSPRSRTPSPSPSPRQPHAIAAAAAAAAAEPAPYRFPHAVRLRLLQPGVVSRYSYSQLAALLQAFRCLGHPVDEAVAGVVGGAMAEQLVRMGPAERSAALEAVLGAGPPCGGSEEEACGVL
ncbi:hypothetical protein HXX76_015180 [Chlamydomonas incerta]|uniref:Uncharacterized protein n=1 Tax=Chlamydomonas incerta TaxID=51695 RepID=A0A835SHS0_CHLIN|nr:hypothetical protein HXX76_015180 [Chlamydomonas incerta]|eukprot:KAG2423663.1 hypothetical protein HXX76_015180 [Chlamydomonas incerta]